MEPESEPDRVAVTELLQQRYLGDHGSGRIVSTNSNHHTTSNDSPNFVLVRDRDPVESGTADIDAASLVSEATSPPARVPAASASGCASSQGNPPNPPLAEPIAALLRGIRVEVCANRSRLPIASERVGWAYFAVWRLPLFPHVHGIVVGPNRQAWSFICAHLRDGRYFRSGAWLRQADTVDLAVSAYRRETLFWDIPDNPWVWIVR
jgi:hypothetical protein